MKMVARVLFLMGILCSPATAQDNWKAFKKPPTRTRLEVGGGVLYRSFSNITAAGGSTGKRLDTVGWSGYADYRFLRWLSLGADLSGSYHRSKEWGNTQIYTVMIGPQLYPLGHEHKLTPFGHIFLGRGFYGLNLGSQGGFNPLSHWDNGFAWMGGGGFDLKFRKRWTIRLLEADYESTHFGASGSPAESNYRVSVGLLYRFGVK